MKKTKSNVVNYESNLLLEEVKVAVDNAKTLEEIKEYLTKYIKGNPKFKKVERKMLINIENLPYLAKGVFYFYNSILDYEGLGVYSWGNGSYHMAPTKYYNRY